MTPFSHWLLPLAIVCAVGNARAQSAENSADASASGAHVSISTGQRPASLEIVPVGESVPVAECDNYCDFWALPGRYTLYTHDHASGEARQLSFRVKHSVRYSLHEGNDSARNIGLTVGIAGSASVLVGIFMTIPVVMSAMCEDSNCVTDSERRTANVGLALMAAGAIATPIGFTVFSENRTTLRSVVDRSYGATTQGTSVHVGVVGVSGGLGLGGLAVF